MRRGCLALALLWFGAVGLAVALLTHRLERPYPEPAPPGCTALNLTTSDGQRLGAWLLGDHGPPLLVLHGIGDSRSRKLLRSRLCALHARVLAPTLRGHGDSSGTLIDFGWSSRFDVEAGVAELERRCPGQRPLIYGHSLGAAAALFAAGDLGNRVAGYLLESPYRDLLSAVRYRLEPRLGPLTLPTLWSMELWARAFLPVDRISPQEAVRAVPADLSVTILAGANDPVAPPTDAEAIARNHPGTRVVIFPGAGHDRLRQADPAAYEHELQRFVDSM